jgi:hypothetical protein
MFQKNYAGQILGCHLQLLNAIRTGDYLPDRVTNLILQYLTNRFVFWRCGNFHVKQWFASVASHLLCFLCLILIVAHVYLHADNAEYLFAASSAP